MPRRAKSLLPFLCGLLLAPATRADWNIEMVTEIPSQDDLRCHGNSCPPDTARFWNLWVVSRKCWPREDERQHQGVSYTTSSHLFNPDAPFAYLHYFFAERTARLWTSPAPAFCEETPYLDIRAIYGDRERPSMFEKRYRFELADGGVFKNISYRINGEEVDSRYLNVGTLCTRITMRKDKDLIDTRRC